MKKGKCKQIQLKLPFEPDAEAGADVEIRVMPLDTRASHHLEQHSKGLVDIPDSWLTSRLGSKCMGSGGLCQSNESVCKLLTMRNF